MQKQYMNGMGLIDARYSGQMAASSTAQHGTQLGDVEVTHPMPAVAPRMVQQGTYSVGTGRSYRLLVQTPPLHSLEAWQVNYPTLPQKLNAWTLGDGHSAVRRVGSHLWEVRTKGAVPNLQGNSDFVRKALLRFRLTGPSGLRRSLPEATIRDGDSYYADLLSRGRAFFPGDPAPSKVGRSGSRDYRTFVAGSAASSLNYMSPLQRSQRLAAYQQAAAEQAAAEADATEPIEEIIPADIVAQQEVLPEEEEGVPTWMKAAGIVAGSLTLVGGALWLTRR